ncbi:hypothetical protein ALPR1_20948 [Algoriphagus machipongonensis]|uniref:Uncharacterized protein n=2 Tax=Algoriphagus machipongonensis TaxID=388413 RepID=A3HY71_9BACT|nr:hypothetical protein ALPR1_20948 [Algoriphagus machipongonensis]
MSKEVHHTKSPHPLRKKLIRWVMVAFLSLLFLEFVVYFGSNLLLSNWARNKITEATEEVYNVEFNRINFSLLRRGIFLDGIIMKPTEGIESSAEQTLFDFSLDELALRGLWFSFSDNVFYIGSLEFENPNFKMNLPDKPDSKEKAEQDSVQVNNQSPVTALENELKKSIARMKINGVVIRELNIDHADLFFMNFLSQNTLTAENTRLLVRDINLTNKEEWTTPFNARGFEFDLEKVNFKLPDGVHDVIADKVYVSSLDNQIELDNFFLTPDKNKESKAYYFAQLNNLRLGNVDLNQAFMTSRVMVDELVLDDPQFKVERMVKAEKDTTGSENLNDLIDGLLKSIDIQELSINRGKFITSDALDTLKNRIDIEGMDFKMVNFYLGDDENRKENQFFYGEDAAMEIRNASLYLSDEIHLIEGERISVSSFKDEIDIQNVSFQPRPGALEGKDPLHIIRVSIPNIALKDANLKLLYNEGRLEMNGMRLNAPKVEITELRKRENDSTSRVSIKGLLEGYLSEVNIGKFNLDNGEIQFKNEAGERSDDIGFEKFSLELDDVYFQPNTSKNISDFLLAKGVILSLDQYRLKLRDNLHEFTADNVTINSKDSIVTVSNLNIGPENPDQVQEALDAYGKSMILSINIPEFRAEGFDVRAAFEDERLEIQQILIPSPEIAMRRFRKSQQSKVGGGPESSDDVSSLLTSYFNEISIDSVSFSDGKIKYQNYSGKKDIQFQEDNLGLKLKSFYVNREGLANEDRTFFSEEIDLSLGNYAFNLANGNYIATTRDLKYNSLEKTIIIDSLSLEPGPNLNNKIALSLMLPQVAFQGVDIESFLFQNVLDLNKLGLTGGQINIEINRDFEADTIRSEVKTNLPKSIESIQIDSIQAVNSTLGINFRTGTSGAQSILTKFEIAINGFVFDSTTNTKEDLSGLFSEINLSLEDFSFALPDSMHTIKFSSVNVDNTLDATIFSDFQIIPKNTTGSPGKPIISAQLESLSLENNTLKDIQETGVFELNKITLNSPEINVYLDSAENKKEKKTPKSADKEGLVQSILLQDIQILDGRVALHNKSQGAIDRLAFESINLELDDLNLDLLGNSQNISPQFILEKDLRLSISNYHFLSKDSMNRVKIGKVSLLDDDIIVENISFGPSMGRYNYLNQKGFQSDAIDGQVKKLTLKNIDFDQYFQSKNLKAQALILNDLELDVFRDKRLPEEEGIYKAMPQALMSSAAFDLEIDSVLVENGIVRYQEFGPKSMLPGSVFFDQMNVRLTPFVLSKEGTEYPLKSSQMIASTRLMGEGEIKLKGELFYEDPYPMDIEVELGAFDLTKINNMVSRGVFVRILEGKVIDGDWRFTLDEEEAIGDMNFHYEDLKIEFLDSLTLERGKGKLGFMTFMANTIAKNSNPRKLFNKSVNSRIYFERDKSKFVFGAWWRATFSGLKGALGLGQAKVPRRKEEEE